MESTISLITSGPYCVFLINISVVFVNPEMSAKKNLPFISPLLFKYKRYDNDTFY